jgi:transposase
MDRYIGIDVHTKTCTLAIMNAAGKRLKELVLETDATLLIETMRGVAGTVHVCIEEGTLTNWLYELLEPHVDELVVIQPEKKPQGSKSDSIDAWALADQIRTRRFGRRVFKMPRRFCGLRQAVRAHHIATKDTTRAKNRLNAVYRSRGVKDVGDEIYDPKKRTAWLRKLPGAYRTLAETLSLQLDGLLEAHSRAEDWVRREGKLVPEVRRLMTVDGLGPIRSAQIVAVVVTPERFRTKQQFWKYCGLGVVTHVSAEWDCDRATHELVRRKVAKPRGLNRNRNAMLKNAFKGAAETVVGMPSRPLSLDYHKSVAAGAKPNLALLTTARRIAAAVLAIWKHKEDYTPDKHRSRAA